MCVGGVGCGKWLIFEWEVLILLVEIFFCFVFFARILCLKGVGLDFFCEFF